MGSISIVGFDTTPDPTIEFCLPACVHGAATIIVPSPDGRIAQALAAEGVRFTDLTELGLDARAPVERIIERLVELAEIGDVVYISAAMPIMREGLLSGLLARSGGRVDVYPVLSPLQIILMAFDIDPTADLDIVDVRSLAPGVVNRGSHLIVTGVRNRLLSRRASEQLLPDFPPDHRVVVACSTADEGFALSLRTVGTLAEMDAGENAALFVAPNRIRPPGGFNEFVRLIKELRGPHGCPWDKAQDHLTLRRHMLEEAYEAVAAIEAGDDAELADELGDVLLQVVLHAQIASEEERFDIDEVVARISEKIRRRHPHIFGDARADTPDEVIAHWSAIKREEKADAGLLDSIPASLPALMLAEKISKRVVSVGFEWETLDDVWDKVHEEIDELKATEPGSPEAVDEIGDVLFTVVNLARKQGIDAEEALRAACMKFSARWRHMERAAKDDEVDISALGADGLERLWEDAKKRETRD